MSIRAMSQVWHHAEVEGAELLVLLALADFAGDDGWCWPSMTTIAKKSRMTERGARGIVRRLETKGLLICKLSTGGKGRSSRYQVITNPEQASAFKDPNPVRQTGKEVPGKTSNPERERTKPGTGVPPNHLTVKKGGGRSARAADDAHSSPGGPREPDLLDRVVEAAQIDIQRDRNPQRWFGSEPRDTIGQWQRLGLSDTEIIETVSEVIAGKHDGSPTKLSYFNLAMQRRAGRKTRPALVPIVGGKNTATPVPAMDFDKILGG